MMDAIRLAPDRNLRDPMHRATHRSRPATRAASGIDRSDQGNRIDATGVFYARAMSADKMAVPESPFPKIPSAASWTDDPHGCPYYADHVADRRRADPLDAAAAQLHRGHLPDPVFFYRARLPPISAHVTSG